MSNKYLLFICIILFPLVSFSQTISDLEKQRAKTEKDLQATSQLLEKTSKQREQSMQHVNVLQRQLTLRKKLISEIDNQILLFESDIESKTDLISSYKTDLTKRKHEYAKLIRFAYRNKSDMDLLVFIFSSNDFNQAYRRLRFYQQFLKFREKQALEIILTQRSIEQEVLSVSEARNKLAKSKDDKSDEIIKLNSEQKRYANTISVLQQKEKQLRAEVEQRKKAMAALDKAIEELIAEEARAAAKDKSVKVRDASYLKLSAGFEGNKGRLPWPTSKGIIVAEFGEHNHPVLKGVRIRNNGVDISSEVGSIVRVIYKGEVKKIVSIPGQNLAVIVRHGDFLTVYSNLESVLVKVGDTVSALQPIGQVYSGAHEKQGVFNLQIWKESKIENPTHWILP
ncbi:MAG: peptidoglycan DD-metalloendopeptidase family protein [Bacteroidales bacterium]